MNDSEKSRARFPQWERYAWVLAVVWTVAVAASLVWNVVQVRRNTLEAARIQARVAHGKDVIYRRWNAGHGGVYVPVTDETPPNPYLSYVPERDITTPSGKLLTLMNPAYMTRQVHELAEEEYGVRGHITSLNPIRPENAPDPWETEALQAFERGETEISSIEEMEGEEYMRLMRPLITEKGCLKCHAAQGYQEGDIRGGISVSIPVEPLWAVARMQALTLAGGHAMLWLMGLAGIVLGAQRLRRSERERMRAEERVRRLLDQQTAANQLALAMGETRDLDEIYHIIHEHVRMLMDAEAFIVSFYDDETQLIRAGYVVSKGTAQDVGHFPPIPLEKEGHGTQSQVIHTGEPFYVPDYRKRMERTKTEYTFFEDGTIIEGPPSPEDEDISNSALYVPMKIERKTIGVMQVQSCQFDAYSQEDMDLLTVLANVAAIAIQNARLFEQAQQEITERKRAEDELRQRQLRLSVLNRMGRALAGTFELARIYRIAYEHVAQLVDCPCFGISLYDPTTRTLRAEFMLDDGELIDAARFPPLVMGIEPTQGRVRAIITRQPEIITDYPAALEKATDPSVRVGVSEDEHVTGAAMYVPMVARDQVIGLLEVQSYRLNAYGVEQAALLGPVANQIGLSIQNAQLYEEAQQQLAERKRAEEGLQHTLAKLREALGGIIQTVALTVETKDPYTAGHQRRVGNLARAIANEMGLSEEQIDGIRMAGLIHDLGKIAIPAEILSTPDRLNDLQWSMIKTHPQGGYDILKTIEFPWPVAQIVLQHHERLDGSGYPAGLSGDEIMLEARIMAVADVVEAMASFRPYRPARGIDKALEEISQNRGIRYDPEVVDACLKLFTEKGFEFE